MFKHHSTKENMRTEIDSIIQILAKFDIFDESEFFGETMTTMKSFLFIYFDIEFIIRNLVDFKFVNFSHLRNFIDFSFSYFKAIIKRITMTLFKRIMIA